MTADRLDVALVERGLARSRSAAQTAIASARVRVDGVVATRPAQRVAPDAVVEVDAGTGWVGRGAGKLDAALDAFGIDVSGRLALDLGASTGGFTQVLLERGAARVIALDVGHDQLVPELRADPRVVVVEGENARLLTPERLAELTGSSAAPDADLVLLVKPQFEVGRSRVRGGIVHDAADRATAVRAVLDTASAAGFRTAGIVASPVPGTHGNREALVHLHRLRGSDPSEWSASIERAVRSGGGEVG